MQATQESSLLSFSSIRPITGWEKFLKEGKEYLRTAEAAYRRQKNIFTPEILYNLITMAIEKFFMAALMRHGTMPYNHTMVDMVESMEETFPDAIQGIRDDLMKLDTYQDICDPYDFTIIAPDREEIPSMLDLAERMLDLLRDDLKISV